MAAAVRAGKTKASQLSPMASSQVQKKRKRQKGDQESILAELKTLGKNLLSSSSDINNLPRLLSFIDPAYPPHVVLEALLSLQAFFTPPLPKLSSSYSSVEDTTEFVYRKWLRSKFDGFLRSLISHAVSSQSDETLREVVLDTIMDFVKVGNAGKFHSYVYHKFLCTIVHSTLGYDDALFDLLASKYFQYIDVRYFTYITIGKIARDLEIGDLSDDKNSILETGRGKHSRTSMELSIQKMHRILSSIPLLEGSSEKSNFEMWNGLGVFIMKSNGENHLEKKTKDGKQKVEMSLDQDQLSLVKKKMKLKFSKAWISFLRLPLPLDVYKEVLASLHENVIPYLSNPLLLCDFLTRSYDIGGVVSVMALSSLYILMTQHGLEYTNFYEKLYALLEPSVFMAKYRAKFFQLIDSCLKSPLLPAYLAAAFCKRLSRLALSVPPSGSLVIIALVHNLLRRHPSINFLVHWENYDDNAQAQDASGLENGEGHSALDLLTKDTSIKQAGVDYFNDEETTLVKTNAMRSSLWEIDMLRHHYCPPVSRFVLSLENDLTLRAKTTEVPVQDFSSGSYGTIFSEEIRRRVKQVPLAFYKTSPTCLFSESEFPGWTLKFKSEMPIAEIDGPCV